MYEYVSFPSKNYESIISKSEYVYVSQSINTEVEVYVCRKHDYVKSTKISFG